MVSFYIRPPFFEHKLCSKKGSLDNDFLAEVYPALVRWSEWWPTARDGNGNGLLEWLCREDKFRGEWMLPTLPFGDPEWSKQHYWKGHIWPSPNYIVWEGGWQFADSAQRAEFAGRSVKLFMKGWNEARICSENYRSDTGAPASHPHYTWGALPPLIGVEALSDVGEDSPPAVRRMRPCGEHHALQRALWG